MYATNDFKKGLKIEYNAKPWVIVDFQHVSPGKGAAFTRAKIRNLETAQMMEITVKSGDKVGIPDLEVKEMQYLYSDATTYTFMDTKNYEQAILTEKEIGENKYFLTENCTAKITFFNGKPVAVDVDTFVVLTVKETQPNIRGDTSSGGGKPATMETGLVVQVPFHVNEGDKLKIDTRDSTYVERANK